MIIGHQSYTHPTFSDLSVAECVEKNERRENSIDKLYIDAGERVCMSHLDFHMGITVEKTKKPCALRNCVK